MRYLVATGVLLRLLQRNDPNYSIIRQAVRALLARGDELCCAPQNIVEFWNVCTRPASARGGFGLTTEETNRRVRLIERVFTILEETPAIYAEWHRLVVDNSVAGVQVHDARIVSIMNANGVTRVLTLNGADFSRYAGITSVSRYRVYFGNVSNVVVLLLCGGDKRTQKADIKRAREFWSDYWERAEEE